MAGAIVDNEAVTANPVRELPLMADFVEKVLVIGGGS
jgi:hypothetical protein